MAWSNVRRGPWAWVVIALIGTGCSGSGLVTTSGSVRCDGVPVSSGAISFHPVNGASAPQGAAIVAGRYHIRTPRGRHRVEIVATRPQPGGVELTPGMAPQEQYIPARYNAASTLEADVKGWWSNHASYDLSTAETK
jgi:hypothetical protein